MKRKLLLTFCLLLVSFVSFAGKFVLIPVTETNNLVSLFNNKDLKIHYYCDDYVLATAEKVNYNDAVILDDNAFADVDYYAIVYCFENYKDEYLAKTSKSSQALFSGENFLVMKILSSDFVPAKNDGMVIIRNSQASLPKSAAAYPVITEQNTDILDYISQVSSDTLMSYIQTLQDFETRCYYLPNAVAAQNWIKEQFEAMDLEVSLHTFPVYWPVYANANNVIAIQYGTEFPDEFIVCGAHYDSYVHYPNPPYPPDQSNSPGADDNASGVAGILETARILSQYDFKRSIIYCAFSAEEVGLVGSDRYAEKSAIEDLNIVGYFNLDMIGYVKPGNNIRIDLIYPSNAQTLADYYLNVCDVYFPDVPIRTFSSLSWGNSDHTSFNNRGYKGIWPFENTDWGAENPYIHWIGEDIIGTSVNSPEQAAIFTQTKVASIAGLAMYDQAMPPAPLASPVNCVAEPFQSRRIRVRWEAPIGNTPSKYYIYRDGGKIAETIGLEYVQTFSVNDHNVYCYKVSAVYGSRESEPSNESCTSILSVIEYNSNFKIYPNPANDKIFIDGNFTKQKAEIIDINGKSILTISIESNLNEVDISNLTAGIYFIKVSNEMIGKFVKE
ncbi:MAG: M28 family peptidase [Lentimicrobiaceae bacterium]|nr:M28 family peptidase [Lentimicrobiaceae bacterium]